jgi:hypothetical protein
MQNPSAAHFAKQSSAVDDLPQGRLYDRASLAEERRRWNVSRRARPRGFEAVEAPTDPQSLASILAKKTAAQDEGEALGTGFVMNFSIFVGGLLQT